MQLIEADIISKRTVRIPMNKSNGPSFYEHGANHLLMNTNNGPCSYEYVRTLIRVLMSYEHEQIAIISNLIN